MSSPLNKLADALPSFILQMQELKTRQEYSEALATYRTGMLAETIRTNKLEEDALRATEQLRRAERGREEREDILEARGKYGEAGARAIFPEATPRQFPEGLPPEKEADVSEGPRSARALKEYDRLRKIKGDWETFQEGTKGQKNIMRIIEEQFGGKRPSTFTPKMQSKLDRAAEIVNEAKGYDPRTFLNPIYDREDIIADETDSTKFMIKNTQTGQYDPVSIDLTTGEITPR